MPIEKTWTVTSGNPRPSHEAIDGETVPVGEPFSNGLQYPGDGSTGDAGEVAGCTCVMVLDGEAPPPAAELNVTIQGELSGTNPADLAELRSSMEIRTGQVQDILGPSRWNGEIRIGEAAKGVESSQLAVKQWDCGIAFSDYAMTHADPIQLQQIATHELVHSCSVGLSREGYTVVLQPWEEGIVEGFSQALIRSLGERVTVPTYDYWVKGLDEAWRAISEVTKVSRIDFYKRLLQTPLGDRPALVNRLLREAGANTRLILSPKGSPGGPDWIFEVVE